MLIDIIDNIEIIIYGEAECLIRPAGPWTFGRSLSPLSSSCPTSSFFLYFVWKFPPEELSRHRLLAFEFHISGPRLHLHRPSQLPAGPSVHNPGEQPPLFQYGPHLHRRRTFPDREKDSLLPLLRQPRGDGSQSLLHSVRSQPGRPHRSPFLRRDLPSDSVHPAFSVSQGGDALADDHPHRFALLHRYGILVPHSRHPA